MVVAVGESRWLNSQNAQEWKDLLALFPKQDQDVYFRPEYIGLYQSEVSQPSCFVYQRGEKVFLHSFLLQKIKGHSELTDMTSPYGYGGPISNVNDEAFLHDANKEFEAQAKKRGVVAELVRFHPLLNNQELVRHSFSGKIIDICPTVYVDLQIDEQQRWEKIYSHANRKNINKAKRAGVSIRVGQDEELWNSYFQLYSETMDANRAAGFYYFSPDYYQRLRSSLSDGYVLVGAEIDQKLVSVLIVLFGASWAHCHLIGSKREVMNLGVNNLLHHEAILWAKGRGFSKLHIGGGRGNSADDGLLKFKANFSDQLARFHIGERVFDQASYESLCKDWSDRNPSATENHRLLRYRES